MTNEQTINEIMACADWYRAVDNVGRAKHREKLSGKITEPGEWIEWQGGKCPIADGVKHQVRFRDHSLSHVCDDAASWSWRHACEDFDIVAYRVLP